MAHALGRVGSEPDRGRSVREGAIVGLHALAAAGDTAGLKASAAILGLLEDGMGDWTEEAEPAAELKELIAALLVERAAARKERNFARADAIRKGLDALGLEIIDGADGSAFKLSWTAVGEAFVRSTGPEGEAPHNLDAAQVKDWVEAQLRELK